MVLKLTLREVADICHINLRAAFLWRHRFLSAQAGKFASTNPDLKLSSSFPTTQSTTVFSNHDNRGMSTNNQ